ncbi:hypothetical protein [Pseudomonas sp.]|uniref:hypothetical protein n=1 Tax=Pseudomonas sp. TaxID=306 RepID=UPI00260BFDCD|nr:hypothetical protein [Pseudomonas sp.]
MTLASVDRNGAAHALGDEVGEHDSLCSGCQCKLQLRKRFCHHLSKSVWKRLSLKISLLSVITRAWSMCASAIISVVVWPDPISAASAPARLFNGFTKQIEMTSYIPLLKNWDACLRRELIEKMRGRWLGR